MGNVGSLNSFISQSGMLYCSALHPPQQVAEFRPIFFHQSSICYLGFRLHTHPKGSCVMAQCRNSQCLLLLGSYLTLLFGACMNMQLSWNLATCVAQGTALCGILEPSTDLLTWGATIFHPSCCCREGTNCMAPLSRTAYPVWIPRHLLLHHLCAVLILSPFPCSFPQHFVISLAFVTYMFWSPFLFPACWFTLFHWLTVDCAYVTSEIKSTAKPHELHKVCWDVEQNFLKSSLGCRSAVNCCPIRLEIKILLIVSRKLWSILFPALLSHLFVLQ